MTKLIIITLILIAALLFVATPKISFKPFSITFINGWFALGMALIGLGIGLVRYQGYREGVTKGVDSTFNYLRESIKKEKV
jgi:amino acid transporter